MNPIGSKTRYLSSACVVIGCLLVCSTSRADALPDEMLENPWRARLHGSAGWNREQTLGYTAGAQLVIPANASQGWGPDITWVQTQDREAGRFLAVGLFVEQRFFDLVLTSIGGVGYFPLVDERPVPFGISSKFGFAPSWGLVSPYAGLRIDQVLSKPGRRLLSADIGVSIAFGGLT